MDQWIPGRRWFAIVFLSIGMLGLRGASPTNLALKSGPCRFELHGCTLRSDVVEFLNRGVNALNRDYRESFDVRLPTNPTVRIRIFGTAEDFRRYCATNGPSGNISAFYSVDRDDITTWQQERADILVGILLHEASHALLRQHLGRFPPMWLNEGLAEYMACVQMARTPFGPALQNFRLSKCKEMLDANRFPPLDEILSLKFNRFYKQEVDERYAASWSLVNFLKLSETRENPMLRNLIKALHHRAFGPMGASAFLEENYPGGLTKLEADWKAWVAVAIRYRHL